MSDRAVRLARDARARGLISRWDHAPDLGALLATGPDAAAFLQARLTSDVQALTPGAGQLSARVDRQGRLLAWFSLHRLPDRGQPHPLFLLLLPRDQAAALYQDLESSHISEDVLLSDVSDECHGVVLQGGALPEPTAAAPEYASVACPGDVVPHGAWAVRRSLTGDPGLVLLWFHDGDRTDAVLDHLRGDAVPLDDSTDAHRAWRWLLLEAGRPTVGADLPPAKRILSQTGLEQEAVSWTKGCYVGQEVLARVKAYGAPPESLRALVFPGRGPFDAPPAGTPLTTADGTRVGTWAGAGFSVVRDAPLALAFLKKDHAAPGGRLDLAWDGGAAAAHVVLPPVYRAGSPAERAAHLYEQAVELFRAGDDPAAVARLEQALDLVPDHTDALETLGVILGRLERYAEAVEVFRRLEAAAPTEPMVHANLSLMFMKLGDIEEAERQKALGTMKRFGVSGDAAAAAEQRAAREAEAQRRLEMFREVLDLDPEDPLALGGAGDALTDLGRAEEAEPLLARAVAAQPEQTAPYLKHGKALEALGRADEAAAVYRAGIAVASRRGDLQPLREMEKRVVVLEAGSRSS